MNEVIIQAVSSEVCWLVCLERSQSRCDCLLVLLCTLPTLELFVRHRLRLPICNLTDTQDCGYHADKNKTLCVDFSQKAEMCLVCGLSAALALLGS